jgi:hypothetical protein
MSFVTQSRALTRRKTLATWIAVSLVLLLVMTVWAASLVEATAIRDECIDARGTLRNASELADRPNDDYLAALREGRGHVHNAFRLAEAAVWPESLPATRASMIASLGTTRATLDRLDRLRRVRRIPRIRNKLDREVARLTNVIELLDILVPRPPAPTPVPVPVPQPEPEPVPAPAGTIPDLVPGEGFSDPTPQPDVAGSGAGSDAKAIARWDVVPFQTVATKIPVGVVAFHIAGIEAVDFSLNGGPWTRVTEMTQNPLTFVWEYSASVDPAMVPDGLVEVRAVVRPKKGLSRVLAGPYDEGTAAKVRGEHSLFLYANARGTLPSTSIWVNAGDGDDATADGTRERAFKNLYRAYEVASASGADVSGLTIYLEPGDYVWPASWNGFKDNSRYVTVAGAPGQARTAARITYADPDRNRGLDARRVCVRNLTVVSATLGNGTRGGMIWADGCELTGNGLTDYPWILPEPQWGLGIWLTKPVIRNLGFATGEFRFMRDYEIYDIGEDAIRDLSGFAINGSIHDMRYGKPSVHSDVIQFFNGLGADGQFENVAMYGLKTRRVGGKGEGVQGLFIRNYWNVPSHEDLAFVNCDLEYAGNSQILHSVNHLLIWHCNFMPNPATDTGGSLLLADDPPDSPDTRLRNFSLRNSVLNFLSSNCSTEPLVASPAGGEPWADGNHVVRGPAVGTNVTSGSSLPSLFTDWLSGDYEPSSGSLLKGRLSSLLVPADANSRVRLIPDFVGANVPAGR